MLNLQVTVIMTIALFLAHQATMTSTQHGTPTADNGNDTFQLSRENLFPVLCEVAECFTEDDTVDNEVFRDSRKILLRQESGIANLKVELELRRLDVLRCCNTESLPLSFNCLKDTRRRRIDYLCAKNTTRSLPYTLLRRNFMTQKTEECCFKLGGRRYDCFNENSWTHASGPNNGFSLDETDPINDIWDYPVNASWIKKMARQADQKMTQMETTLNTTEQSHYQRRRHLNQADDSGPNSGQQPATNQQSSLQTSLHAPESVVVNADGSLMPSLIKSQQQTTPANTVTATPRSDDVVTVTQSSGISQTTQRATGRHPGAILEIYRSKIKRTTIALVQTSDVTQTVQEAQTSRVTQTYPRAEQTTRVTQLSFRVIQTSPRGAQTPSRGQTSHRAQTSRVAQTPPPVTQPSPRLVQSSHRTQTPHRSQTSRVVQTSPYEGQTSPRPLHTIPSVRNDIAASIQDRWWVSSSKTPRKRMKPHQHQTKAMGKNSMSSTGTGLGISISQTNKTKVSKRKKSRSHNSLPISRGYRKHHHARRGKGRKRRKDKSKRVKNGLGRSERPNDSSDSTECRFSVLNVDDLQNGSQNLLQMLKRIYKNDVWH